jgi:Cu/Zn superoxide dismutase
MTSARAWVATVATTLCVAACGGEAAATPSSSPPASAKPSPIATFKLAPESGVTATGTIVLFSTSNSTSIELKVSGLQANSSHVSHIHLGSCQERGGIAFALTQVVADGQGQADTKTTLNLKYPPASGHWYVVVHAGPDMQGTNASYLLCGNLFS